MADLEGQSFEEAPAEDCTVVQNEHCDEYMHRKFSSAISDVSSATDLEGQEETKTGNLIKETRSICCKPQNVQLAIKCVVLAGVLCFIVGLFALPTMFFAWRPSQTEEAVSNVTPATPGLDLCLEPAIYTGATCRAELQMFQECFSGSTGSNGDIIIRSDIDQEGVETDAQLLIEGGLSFLNPTIACVAAIRPFLCLYLFGVCDSSSQLHQVSSLECVELRDETCATEWSAAVSLLGQGVLPECEELPAPPTESCVELESGSSFSEEGSAMIESSGLLPTENGTIIISNSNNSHCSFGFYLSEDDLCLPLCGHWDTSDAISIITILDCCIAIISSIAVFVIAFSAQRDTMFKFPTSYLLYVTTSAVVVAVVILIGYMDKAYLFCSSSDLILSLANPSPFCSLSGIVYTYGFLQMSLWILYHVTALFWGLRFPFHYRRFKSDGYVKYIHVTSVAVAVLIPLVPALAPLKDGFVPVGTPPIACSAKSIDYSYYLLVLPMSIILATSTFFLVLIFWIILKELVLKSISKKKNITKAGVAELKITLLFIHYLVMGVLGLIIFSLYIVTQEDYTRRYREYLLCESLGSEMKCPSFTSVRGEALDNLWVAAIILLGLLPFAVLIFTVTAQTLRAVPRKLKKLSSRVTLRSRLTSSSSNA